MTKWRPWSSTSGKCVQRRQQSWGSWALSTWHKLFNVFTTSWKLSMTDQGRLTIASLKSTLCSLEFSRARTKLRQLFSSTPVGFARRRSNLGPFFVPLSTAACNGWQRQRLKRRFGTSCYHKCGRQPGGGGIAIVGASEWRAKIRGWDNSCSRHTLSRRCPHKPLSIIKSCSQKEITDTELVQVHLTAIYISVRFHSSFISTGFLSAAKERWTAGLT